VLGAAIIRVRSCDLSGEAATNVEARGLLNVEAAVRAVLSDFPSMLRVGLLVMVCVRVFWGFVCVCVCVRDCCF
jgi:hypothetical protein